MGIKLCLSESTFMSAAMEDTTTAVDITKKISMKKEKIIQKKDMLVCDIRSSLSLSNLKSASRKDSKVDGGFEQEEGDQIHDYNKKLLFMCRNERGVV